MDTETGARSQVVKLAPHTFWIHKRTDGTVVFHYKQFAADDVWYPPIDVNAKPPVTDPEGIVMFDTPPPDPMITPPTEVELKAAKCNCRRCVCAVNV